MVAVIIGNGLDQLQRAAIGDEATSGSSGLLLSPCQMFRIWVNSTLPKLSTVIVKYSVVPTIPLTDPSGFSTRMISFALAVAVAVVAIAKRVACIQGIKPRPNRFAD